MILILCSINLPLTCFRYFYSTDAFFDSAAKMPLYVNQTIGIKIIGTPKKTAKNKKFDNKATAKIKATPAASVLMGVAKATKNDCLNICLTEYS